MNMQDALVPDDLWEIIERLLPPPKLRKNNAGRRAVPDRACLAGIVYVLRTGCQWRYLPCKELACGSYPTVWRRFATWTRAGVWPRLHQELVNWGAKVGQVDPKHVIIDTASFRAVFGGRIPGPAARIAPKKGANARC
jgi:transposase